MPKSDETVLSVEICISVDLAFIKFATGVSARRMSRLLAWNVFLLLNRRTFWKEASGIDLIPTLMRDPRILAIYLFSLLGTVYIKKKKKKLKKKEGTHTKMSAST